MITITAQRNSQTVQIEFPCNDVYLCNRLKEIGVSNPFDCEQFIKDSGDEIPALAVLNDRFVNLDFLNFLAKRLDSFTENELLQFEASLSVKKFTDMKDIINLSYNLHNYTVINDFSDLAKVGQQHYLTVNMAMPVDAKEVIDFRAIGRQLVSSGIGIDTPYGVLFENQLSTEEIFDGATIPEFYYSECVFSVMVSNNSKTETLYLPTEDITLQKAINRLGAKSMEDCTVDNIDAMIIPVSWLHTFVENFRTLDIDALNKFSRSICEFEADDFNKLMSLADYAQAHDLQNATCLAENIDSFLFVPNVKYTEDLGRYMIQKSGSYKYDEDLEDFYDYEMFGNHLLETQEGKFIDCGYVGISDDVTLFEILKQDENDLTMGGI
jgi:hypothetical protein